MRFLVLMAILGFTSMTALAESRSMPVAASGECVMNKTASVSISFHSIETDFSNIESHLTGKRQQILDLSTQADIEKLLLSSMNYSVSPQAGFQYNISGSLSFNVIPADRAPVFLGLLSKKGFNASLSMSSYPSAGSCDYKLLK